MKVVVSSKLDGNNAKIALDSNTFKKAFEKSKQDQYGCKTITVEVPKVKQAKQYTVELPTDIISSNTADKKIEIDTSIGTITIQNNMFTSNDVKGQNKVSLTIGSADKSGLDKATRDEIGNRPVINLSAKVGSKTVVWNNPDAPVVVSINYKPTAEELKDPEHIVVWYIDV